MSHEYVTLEVVVSNKGLAPAFDIDIEADLFRWGGGGGVSSRAKCHQTNLHITPPSPSSSDVLISPDNTTTSVEYTETGSSHTSGAGYSCEVGATGRKSVHIVFK